MQQLITDLIKDCTVFENVFQIVENCNKQEGV